MYQPKPPPDNPDAKALAQYVFDELQAVSQAHGDVVDFLQLNVLYAEPTKPREGVIVRADGTTWNPGSGAGFYGYTSGAWTKF